VSFGEDTSLPHGGETDRALDDGDVVLIDTGTSVDGYNSDITRSYVFGEPTKDVRLVWDAEKRAQAAAFDAAKIGAPCESVDYAARASMRKEGFGPDYHLPGLPHRTGHGIGLEVHEAPNLVRGDRTPLEAGMCFSNEPMIVVPGKFGIRLEDHFYMTDAGARWFTEPSFSLDEPFKGVVPLD
jgi:Xaa-Pro dipeptidase